MFDPEYADRYKGHEVGDVRGPLVQKVVGEMRRRRRPGQVQHEQGQRDREDPVDECVKSRGSQIVPPALSMGRAVALTIHMVTRSLVAWVLVRHWRSRARRTARISSPSRACSGWESNLLRCRSVLEAWPPTPIRASSRNSSATGYAPAYRTAALLLGDASKVDDAVQEAFLRLWRFRDALPEGDGLRPWIYRVVVNACYSSARAETRHAGRRAPQDALDAVVSCDATPDEIADQHDRASLVRQAILSLPTGLRVPLVLRYYAGLSEREIATAIRRRPGTVKSRLHEARRLLANDWRLAQLGLGLSTSSQEGAK